MLKHLWSFAAMAVIAAGASPSSAQVSPIPAMPGPAGGPMMQVTLTTDAVERLLKAIPEVSKESTVQHEKMLKSMEGGGDARPSPDDMKRLQTLLRRAGHEVSSLVLADEDHLSAQAVYTGRALLWALPGSGPYNGH